MGFDPDKPYELIAAHDEELGLLEQNGVLYIWIGEDSIYRLERYDSESVT